MPLDSASPEGRALTALMELPDDAAARLHRALADLMNRTGSMRAALFAGARETPFDPDAATGGLVLVWTQRDGQPFRWTPCATFPDPTLDRLVVAMIDLRRDSFEVDVCDAQDLRGEGVVAVTAPHARGNTH